MNAPFIVTMDGPAGVGKSTLAKRLAAALGIAYLDTGAMFRTVALAVFSNGEPLRNGALRQTLDGFDFALQNSGENTGLLCNGRLVGNEIRTEEAGMRASKAGQIPEVRAYLKEAQQRLGAKFSLVAEGRDMGTVVFPGALCKFFLDARPEVRAERRMLQLREMGVEESLESLIEQIKARDDEDRNRPIAPLKPAPDACILDTSSMSIEEVFAACMDMVNKARQAE